jgi:formate/nitrite transporter
MNAPNEIAKKYLAVGKAKVVLPIQRMFPLAMLAGIYIALAGVGASAASVTVENASLAKLVGACVFPAGLTLVLLAGSELFTGNCLLILPLLSGEIRFSQMLRNLIIVYLGNLMGAILAAWLVVQSHTFNLFDNGLAVFSIQTAVSKCSLSFGDAFIRGLLCNFLVCLAVWVSFAAQTVSGKIMGLFFPILLFVLCGYEHSIANMYYIPAGLFCLNQPTYVAAAAQAGISTASLTWSHFFLSNLLPVTLGNMTGGFCLGAVYWWIYMKK